LLNQLNPATVEVPKSRPALFATFPRRLKALSVDGVVGLLFAVLIFALVPMADSLPAVRAVMIVACFVVLVLYEPVMVSRYGGTVGHYLLNLRVVDGATGGNMRFGPALGRLVIKGLWGFLSFFTMPFTQRHRALHDMLTDSTVQIRHPAKASPHHYVLERPMVLAKSA
jgi:uncharacterized RDD family membrane protein YckC